MFSKRPKPPEIDPQTEVRNNSTIVPNSFGIKNMPNLTTPSELPEDLKKQFKNYKQKYIIWQIGCPTRETKGSLRSQDYMPKRKCPFFQVHRAQRSPYCTLKR